MDEIDKGANLTLFGKISQNNEIRNNICEVCIFNRFLSVADPYRAFIDASSLFKVRSFTISFQLEPAFGHYNHRLPCYRWANHIQPIAQPYELIHCQGLGPADRIDICGHKGGGGGLG